MNPFDFVKAGDVSEAGRAFNANAEYLAGGTNLLDLMKEGVARPSTVIDLTRLELTDIEGVDDGSANGGLRIGGLSKNSDTANHPLVRRRFPLLSQAILSGASAQIRNMATAGGNLNQRTRCPYFYETGVPCNKRVPGTGCSAIEGINRSHAIFGWTEACVATSPSDMSVALAALDATVDVIDPGGNRRRIALLDYHRLPGNEPCRDNTLRRGEIVMSVTIPGNSLADHSIYLKVRERTSYAFALVSVAAALALEDDVIADVRVAMGGVAHKPWRATKAEQLLRGQVPSQELFEAAAACELEAATPLRHNGFKIELGRRLIVRGLQSALVGTGGR